MTRPDNRGRARIASRPLIFLGALAAVTAGAAFSCTPSVPSPDQTIWGCYSRDDGHLIVIDHEAGETCPEGFNPLNWKGEIPGAPTTMPPTTPTPTTIVPTTGTTRPPATTTTSTTTTTEPPPPG